MRIDRLHIQNFLGIHSLEVDLDTPVTLIAGHNAAGKSSVADALRLAFCGEAGRVRHKKDFGALVASTAKDGRIVIDTEDDRWDVSVIGKSSQRPDIPDALPYVLDAQRFASLDSKGRRQFLSNLLGVSATPETVATMVRERGCDPDRFEQVKPLLRSGFDAAHQDCKMRATEAKGAWRQITGESWGSSKGENWQPEKPAEDVECLKAKQHHLEFDLEEITEELAEAKCRAEQEEHLAARRERAAKEPELARELEALEAEMAALIQREDELRQSLGIGGQLASFTCPDCHATHRVLIDRGRVSKVPDTTNDPVMTGELEKIVAQKNQLRPRLNRCRDQLSSAQAAKRRLEEATREQTRGPVDIDTLRARQAALREGLDNVRQQLSGAEHAIRAGVGAQDAHREILAWLKLAEAFAPDGIPGELLARTIKPINSRLRESAEASGWPQVAIDVDMTITADGRRFELLSESEQWRCNAMIAEAIAHRSSIRLLVLDRMDVLDIPSRTQCVRWLDRLAASYDSVLVMATMKAPPSGLPASFSVLWLEDGRIAAPRQEAA